MGVGKYSPARVPKPLVDYVDGQPVDEDGYDMYGYDPITGKDREGFTEEDYQLDLFENPPGVDTLYDRVLLNWLQYGVNDE